MIKETLAVELINAVLEIVLLKKEIHSTTQDFSYANTLFKETVKNKEDFISLMEHFVVENRKIQKEDQVKIFHSLNKMYRELNFFDNECIRILSMR